MNLIYLLFFKTYFRSKKIILFFLENQNFYFKMYFFMFNEFIRIKKYNKLNTFSLLFILFVFQNKIKFLNQ